jgi:hypothetical protein
MKTIYIVCNRNIPNEDYIIAVFDKPELATAFTERLPALKGRYEIIEKEQNPFFVNSDLQPYLVVLHPWDEKHVMVEPIFAFDEEIEAFHEAVSKVDEAFFMYMYAVDWQEAEEIARNRLKEMEENGEWMLLKDRTDK